MNLIALSLRNLVRQKRRTLFLASAVALGFAVVALLLGLSGGLVANLKANLSHSFGGQVFVKAEEWNAYGKVVSRVTRADQIETAVESVRPALVSVSRRSTVEATLVFGSRSSAVGLVGVQAEQEAGFRDSLTSTAGPLPAELAAQQLLLNAETAVKLGAGVGDQLLVKFKTLDGQQNVLDYTVAGVIKTSGGGIFSTDSYLNLAEANKMLGLSAGEYQSLNLWLKDQNQQESVATTLERALAAQGNVKLREAKKADANPMQGMIDQLLGDNASSTRWEGPRYQVSVLNDFMSTFVSLTAAIQAIALVIFVIVMAVIVIGISNTFRMILQERTVEIGTLRALGLRKKGILGLFLWEAAAVIVLGLVAGGLLAFVVGLFLSGPNLGGDSMVGMFLAQGHLLFQPEAATLTASVIFVLFAGLWAAWGPARKAANLFPADALRHRG